MIYCGVGTTGPLTHHGFSVLITYQGCQHFFPWLYPVWSHSPLLNHSSQLGHSVSPHQSISGGNPATLGIPATFATQSSTLNTGRREENGPSWKKATGSTWHDLGRNSACPP